MLSELSTKMRQTRLLLPKVGIGWTYDDAEVLANYAGLRPDYLR